MGVIANDMARCTGAGDGTFCVRRDACLRYRQFRLDIDGGPANMPEGTSLMRGEPAKGFGCEYRITKEESDA